MSSSLADPMICVSVDLDTLHHYRAIHGLPARDAGDASAPDRTYTLGLRRALKLFEELELQATLFVVGRDVQAPEHLALLRQAHELGHELASHSHEHRYDLRSLPAHVQLADLIQAEVAIESIAGHRPVGFRAPGYNLDQGLLALLAQRRYLYDSSIFPCPPYYAAKAAVMAALLASGRPSGSAMTQPQTLLAPMTPYRPSARQLWRHDARSDRPLELPIAVIPGLRLPLIGTSLHLLGFWGFDVVWPRVRRAHPRCLQLELHSIDFMDAQDLEPQDAALVARQPDLRVPWVMKRRLYEHVFTTMLRHGPGVSIAAAARALQATL